MTVFLLKLPTLMIYYSRFILYVYILIKDWKSNINVNNIIIIKI